jgi:hypothetical protein
MLVLITLFMLFYITGRVKKKSLIISCFHKYFIMSSLSGIHLIIFYCKHINKQCILICKKYFILLVLISSLGISWNVFWLYLPLPTKYWHIHSPSLIIQLYILLFFQYFRSNLCCPYWCVYVTYHWRMIDLPGVISLNKSDSSFDIVYQLAMIFYIKVWISCLYLLPMLRSGFSWAWIGV